MRIDIVTLFPEMVEPVLAVSMLGRARARGLVDFRVANLRDYAQGKHRSTDDYQFGGGGGAGVQEGVSERLADDLISIGDYVLTGGDLPALVVTDAVARLLPGVLGAEGGAEGEAFASGRLGPP